MSAPSFCNYFKLCKFLFALCCLQQAYGLSEAGNFIFKTYAPSAYGASPQNWVALEDSRGVMYFGNTDGLLEFDGVSWRLIRLPNAKAVRSLAMTGDGVVYIGGQNEIGYLAADRFGAMRYVSILDKLETAQRTFGDVWSIVATPDGVYFSTSEKLIFYNPSKGMRIWKGPDRLRRAFLIDKVLHVNVPNIGLHRLVAEKLELVPGWEKLSKADVRGLIQTSRGTTLATTRGFFLRTPDGFEPVSLPVFGIAEESSLYSIGQLTGGLLALGTERGGLFLAGPDGRLHRLLNKQSGLPSDYIASVSQDRQGGVWIATGNGIVRFAPRLTYFDENSGLRGALLCLTRWKDSLYVGTRNGLFKLTEGPEGKTPTFVAVPGINESVWSLQPHEKSLLVGARSGLLDYDGKSFASRSNNSEVVYDIAFSQKEPNLVFAAMRSVAHVLKLENNKWNKINEISTAGEEFRTIADDENGILWATTRTSIVRADLRSSPPEIRTFTEANGLPKGWKNVFRVGNRLLFATEQGLVKFDGNKGFIPDPILGARFSDGSHGILLIREDPRNGNLWISGAGYHGLLVRPFAKDAEWQPMPFVNAGFEDLWAIHPDQDGIVWTASSDGRLGRLDPSMGSTSQRPIALLIRRLIAADTKQPIHEGSPTAAINIKPSQNNLRLEFAAPFFDAPERVEYQLGLDSAIDESAPWSKEAWKDLSNLWEGQHRLRVRARNPYGQVSAEESIFLDIEPPWYRTVVAYLVYAAVLVGLIWIVFRWRLRSLRESNRQLERIVEERTTEIRQQRDQIIDQEKQTEALLLNILPAPVAAELRTKGSVAPMRFDDVTVCFTDFVGFTLSSEKIGAEELVAKLHEYFTEFDKIISKYGLEKLKTIGDSYMFVSGLPEPSPSHAHLAVTAALEIVERAKALGESNPDLNWRLRVGLHSGPVVAGVVGFKKFAFDIWGDTVNLASRMESSGVPNRVNLSERTFQEVKDYIRCEPRGLVRTKDGRELPMYFAMGSTLKNDA